VASDLRLLGFTVATALAATAIVVPIGVLAAWWLSRWRGPGKVVVETALSLPLVLPPTAVGLLLLTLLDTSSPIGRLFDRMRVEVLLTWKAVVLAGAVMALPLAARSARSALEEVDPRLLDVARTLGCGRAGAFFRVALPLAWRGILAGALLAFSRALGEFGATILVAGNIPHRTQTLSLAIFARYEHGDDRGALRLVAVATALAFAAVAATEIVTRRRARRASR
jgi:molybdate transport system permease protein